MIEASEHFYTDDPMQGPHDVRTQLKDVAYFFLGNGKIQAAVQVAEEGTPVGLLFMDPEKPAMKRECLNFNPARGFEESMLTVTRGRNQYTPQYGKVTGGWDPEKLPPTVVIQWKAGSLPIREEFSCHPASLPSLLRTVHITNPSSRAAHIIMETGIQGTLLTKSLQLEPGTTCRLSCLYNYNRQERKISLSFSNSNSSSNGVSNSWSRIHRVCTGNDILDHFFRSSVFQLPAVVSENGISDASMWQYNREWVRDQSMLALGLLASGYPELAGKILHKLFVRFVSGEGDTIDSSLRRSTDEVELDQNGVLLVALQQYVLWMGDIDFIKTHWERIRACAEFPLKEAFRHSASHLLVNSREFWERHRLHGIKPGMELTYQAYVAAGLKAASWMAMITAHPTEESRWEQEAETIRQAALYHPQYSFVREGRLVKRLNTDGSIQERVSALPEARLPHGSPLQTSQPHYLNPDTSSVLPVLLGWIDPMSGVASATLSDIESLWNQAWKEGGYGRYHVSSEPDSPGAWSFPSLFLARAYAMTGNTEAFWRIIDWFSSLPGARAGSWFEFYGKRISPPFPQVGIVPWAWAEMCMLIVHQLVGLRLEPDQITLFPFLAGRLDHIQASFRIRDHWISVDIRKGQEGSFRTNGMVRDSGKGFLAMEYPVSDIWIEAVLNNNLSK
jgi:hypothetical protein